MRGCSKIFKPWLLELMRPFVKKTVYDQFKHFIRPLGETYIQNYRKGIDKLFYNAPAVIIFHHSPYADAVDATIACTYAMLAAESLGLGSTMIGAAAPILQRNKSICIRWGMPENNTPSIALILGYPAVKFEKSIKRRFTHVSSVC
jgi:nitroreductase